MTGKGYATRRIDQPNMSGVSHRQHMLNWTVAILVAQPMFDRVLSVMTLVGPPTASGLVMSLIVHPPVSQTWPSNTFTPPATKDSSRMLQAPRHVSRRLLLIHSNLL